MIDGDILHSKVVLALHRQHAKRQIIVARAQAQAISQNSRHALSENVMLHSSKKHISFLKTFVTVNMPTFFIQTSTSLQ